MWVSIASEAACASTLRQAVDTYFIDDTWTLQRVLQHDAAAFARALCTALRAEAPSRSSTGNVTDTATMPTVSVGTEAVADEWSI